MTLLKRQKESEPKLALKIGSFSRLGNPVPTSSSSCADTRETYQLRPQGNPEQSFRSSLSGPPSPAAHQHIRRRTECASYSTLQLRVSLRMRRYMRAFGKWPFAPKSAYAFRFQ